MDYKVSYWFLHWKLSCLTWKDINLDNVMRILTITMASKAHHKHLLHVPSFACPPPKAAQTLTTKQTLCGIISTGAIYMQTAYWDPLDNWLMFAWQASYNSWILMRRDSSLSYGWSAVQQEAHFTELPHVSRWDDQHIRAVSQPHPLVFMMP